MARDIITKARLEGGEIRTKANIGNTVYGTEVHSVNGKAGHVVLDAEDVGALPSDTPIPSLDGYATEEWVQEQGYATLADIPTDVSAFNNDAGYLTQHQDISGKADKSEIPTKVSDLTNDAGYLTQHQSLSGYATEAWVRQQGYLTQHQSLANYALKSEIPTVTNDFTDAYKGKVDSLWEDYQDAITALG